MEQKQSKVVVIGGGPAGRVVLHALRKMTDAPVSATLIKDEEVNANRCAIPFGIAPTKPVEQFLIPNTLVTDSGADLVIDRVVGIDTARSEVTTERSGVFGYEHLVLATGARPIMPQLPGIEARRIVPLRSREDMVALREMAQQFRKAVIVGGGYIGLEVAVVLRTLGLDVAIIEQMPHIASATIDEEFSGEIEESLRAHGITLLTEARATEFLQRDGVVTGVRLESGETLDADFVVVSVGVAPNTDLGEAAGITTSRYGFVTDEFLRTNIPNVYASGDCAEKKSLITGRPVRGELGTNAVFMSRVVAANILGKSRRFAGVLNTNVTTAFAMSFGSAGLMERMARAEGLDVVVGRSDVLSKYPMMDGVDHIKTKLVFDRQSRKLIGGSVLRKDHATVHHVDFLSLAIQMGATAEHLLNYQYATHPELAARPSDNMYVFAVQDALQNW